MRADEAVLELEKHDVRASHPRLTILGFLQENRTHPTAEEVYTRLQPENPTLSLTTVYNTLKLFVRKGIVDPVLIEENGMRYDIDRSLHGHFKCLSCGKVFDLKPAAPHDPVSRAAQLLQIPQGFKVGSTHIHYHGECAECRDKRVYKRKNITKRRIS